MNIKFFCNWLAPILFALYAGALMWFGLVVYEPLGMSALVAWGVGGGLIAGGMLHGEYRDPLGPNKPIYRLASSVIIVLVLALFSGGDKAVFAVVLAAAAVLSFFVFQVLKNRVDHKDGNGN